MVPLMLTATLSIMTALGFHPLSLGAEEGDEGGDEAKARRELVGTWKGFAVEGRGETPDRGPVKLELKITERTIRGREIKGAKVVDHGEGSYLLDLGKDPRHLDASKVNERGRKESYVGIYSVEGDTLKWCVSRRDSRPTEFRTGEGAFLLILKRQAEAQDKR